MIVEIVLGIYLVGMLWFCIASLRDPFVEKNRTNIMLILVSSIVWIIPLTLYYINPR